MKIDNKTVGVYKCLSYVNMYVGIFLFLSFVVLFTVSPIFRESAQENRKTEGIGLIYKAIKTSRLKKKKIEANRAIHPILRGDCS